MDGDTRECWDHDFTMVWGLGKGKGKGKFPKGCFERIRQESQIVSSDSIGVYLSVPAWAAGNEGENEVGGGGERETRERGRQTDRQDTLQVFATAVGNLGRTKDDETRFRLGFF
ncbi:hypothetical protein BDDG_12456 [Blastomyces dermatitidis ATCC 18188]|uniref:Uncharacterized protein n=1 Tax=Ajellomyces dermatitidis (strain ATCC 18188 / CBS 674.68) TaxID=653446 RepID=A0A0J9ERZ2_AJEDA|nr:hypothetical protein BDDG_12456 [Blastomyces dermatitidis ATCC 18188]